MAQKKDYIKAFVGTGGRLKDALDKTIHQISEMISKRSKKIKKEPIKVVEVVASVSRKINLGNYETKDFFCSMKAEITEQDPVEIYRRLSYRCETEIDQQVQLETNK